MYLWKVLSNKGYGDFQAAQKSLYTHGTFKRLTPKSSDFQGEHSGKVSKKSKGGSFSQFHKKWRPFSASFFSYLKSVLANLGAIDRLSRS